MDSEVSNCLRYILSLYDILTYRQKLELIDELTKRAAPVSDRHETD